MIPSSYRASSAGDMQHPPFAGQIAEHVPGGTAQPLGIGLAGDQQINPHTQQPQALAEGPPALELLLRPVLGLAHDHRQIQIGSRVRLAPALEPKVIMA